MFPGPVSHSDQSFPRTFTWGAAAASYQIEGAWDAQGKGLSIWDMLTRQPGRIWEGHNGNTACDHYHRYRQDIGLMQEIGLEAYRLSVSWPRVMPAGIGLVNEQGLGFYDALVDRLLEHNIEPWVTLFHWDYPYELYLRGGWLNPDSPKWFADYTAVIVERLSDRVSHWMTFNEPQCFLGLGHMLGEHAPGLKLGLHEVLRATHNVLLAHGMSVQAIRANSRRQSVVGWAPVGAISYPVSDSEADIQAARETTFTVFKDSVWNNAWYADPVVLGHYPESGLQAYGSAVPKFPSSDFDIICQPIDFYGTNTYAGMPTQATPAGPIYTQHPPGFPHTLFLWRQTPEALYWGPKFLAERYKLPIVITENGMSGCDWVDLSGRVRDTARIDFLHRHLLALHQAIREGVDVRGYFQWSVMDNFEWAEGYKHRFGLIHVDFETQKRTLKDSAYWYRDVIRSNGAKLYQGSGEESHLHRVNGDRAEVSRMAEAYAS